MGSRASQLIGLRVGIEKVEYIVRSVASTIRNLYRPRRGRFLPRAQKRWMRSLAPHPPILGNRQLGGRERRLLLTLACSSPAVVLFVLHFPFFLPVLLFGFGPFLFPNGLISLLMAFHDCITIVIGLIQQNGPYSNPIYI